MKKFLSVLAAVVLAGAPMIAQAATFVSREEYSQGPQSPVVGNLYVAAGVVSIASGVGGDLMAVGGTISVSGRVDRDVTAAGGTVQILGPVGDDVRIGGGQVSISDRVGGDLIVAGGTVNILPSAVIRGDLTVAGGQVVIDGTVQGSVHMNGGSLSVNGTVLGDVSAKTDKSLSLGSDAHIAGSLRYRSANVAVIAQGARVDGETTYTPAAGLRVGKGFLGGAVWRIIAAMTAIQVLVYLGFVVGVVWLWRRWATELSQDVIERWWPMVGHGLLYTILVPIGAVLLLLSFVGAFFGGLGLLAYIAVMVMAKGLAGIVFGAWISKKFNRKSALHVSWTNAILGTIGFMALTLIPILGFVVQTLVILAVFGVLAGRAQKMLF